jgi:hypothetical protein
MKVSESKRTEMNTVDGSDIVNYSAIVNDSKMVRYSTDGLFRKHMSMEQWNDYVKKEFDSNKL